MSDDRNTDTRDALEYVGCVRDLETAIREAVEILRTAPHTLTPDGLDGRGAYHYNVGRAIGTLSMATERLDARRAAAVEQAAEKARTREPWLAQKGPSR